MTRQQKKIALTRAFAGAIVLTLAGCGGGSDGGGAVTPTPTPTPTPPASTTTPSSTTVIDGAIQNALVCLDKNGNGVCDAGESQGKTDVAGKVTIDVPNADLGKFPVLAVIGTDAVDADSGAVKTAYTLSAPADQGAVVSPLTTLVQQLIATSGVTTNSAAAVVQNALGLSASLFQDYTKAAAPTGSTLNPATAARMLVLATQEQRKKIAAVVGSTADDGGAITSANVDQAIQMKLLVLLPSVLAALSDSSVLAAATPAAKEAALLAAATALVSSSGLTAAAMPTVVAINHQTSTAAAVVPYVPTGELSLTNLRYVDSSNFFIRSNGSSLAQATPDVNKVQRYVERRLDRVAGVDTTWGSGGSVSSNSDLSWSGTAWSGCPINFENTNTLRDGKGNGNYTFCGRETGTSSRAGFDVGGQSMVDVYNKMWAAGYSNLSITNAVGALGSSTFPAGATVFYQASTPLTTGISYSPKGVNSPVGTSGLVSQYPVEAAADAALNGGISANQPAGRGCNAPELDGNGSNSVTLEGFIGSRSGNPCINLNPGTFVYGGTTYTSDAPNESWGAFTISMGVSGTAPVGTGAAPGFYSGNTKYQLAFKGSGANPVTYYACKQRFTDGSTRNCVSIGTGTYAIETLGDARALTLNNVPQQIKVARGGSDRVFVERGGHVYYGYKTNLGVSNSARLNAIGANALLAQLGVPAVNTEVPLALTFGSYQGVWDWWVPGVMTVDAGTRITISNTGAVSCKEQSTGISQPCAMTSFDSATGAFVATANPMAGVTNTLTGTLNFATGIGSGTFSSPSATPSTGSFVMGRR